MLAGTRRNQRERRGIVLVLILAVLGLMAVVGITFATFSGQSRISARNFAQSVNQPQRDELMDYALSQLICDTPDIRSSIRGHSMARDMYGNDASGNGYVTVNSDGSALQITGVTNVSGTLYNLTTNIVVGDPAFYGYNFTRWTLRVRMVAGYTNTGVVDQSLEVLNDIATGANRVFTVNINPTDSSTSLINPTPAPGYPSGFHTDLPGQYLVAGTGTHQFVLDGRWLHAFNGPGMAAIAVHGNFRYNGLSPDTTGMDEDYDAVDLENWFLAMQSADGQLMIPSFHRPAAIRIDAANTTDDWSRTPGWTFDMSRILRPVAGDGHDASTFPDLRPDSTGRITYDVDNDGDGTTDSVWLDLGYPARRNAQGQLYKPLFSFMVIGLNGRIPLNTAGNLAGRGSTHATHLGNSVSEVDPTYALQNGFDPAFGQVDIVGVDVRLTQLRNLLAGTRTFDTDFNPTLFPYAPSPPINALNGDANWVQMGADALGNPIPFYMPNGLVDLPDTNTAGISPPAAGDQVMRSTQPVAGRWGEAQSVPGYPIVNPMSGAVMNLLGNAYNNRIRAGYSLDVGDVLNDIPRDAADDNYNSFDPFPAIINRGELGDLDYYDPVGALLLPVERIRRYVTPADINGTGHIVQWDGQSTAVGQDRGGDLWGRVEYSSYFRPPGLPGQVAPGPVGALGTGVITFQWTTTPTAPPVYPADMVSAFPNNNSNNNNPLHGFEGQRFPNLNYPAPPPPTPPTFSPQRAGGVPIDLPLGTPPYPATPYPILPTTLPTYDEKVNAHVNSDGLNEADEMNLYQPNPQIDSPFGYSDLEWLYRQQDVDGSSLTSRLAKLAPISFRNTAAGDAQRRRRLFALDSWELNNYAWANDNPATPAAPLGVFQYNARYKPVADTGFATLNVTSVPPPGVAPANPDVASLPLPPPNLTPPTPLYPYPAPTIVHRDKKINLNYPLPVSNDPNEPIRQKWITDTYYTLKAILPPRAVDTPEELAQLSQYVINIIDFRDPDATMTHWINPDISMAVWNGTGTIPVSPVLIAKGAALPTNTVLSNTTGAFDQYGMEFNPIAINEVLAYSFLRKDDGGNATATPRFFIELANTLTSPETGTATNNASILDLSGLLSNGSPTTAPQTPWDNACWDIIFTDDNANNRPDPYLGQLQPPAPGVLGTTKYGVYGLVPLSQNAMIPPPAPPPATDVNALPLPQAPVTTAPGVPFGQYYFTVIGNDITNFPSYGTPTPPPTATESVPPSLTPPNEFTIQNAWDPVDFNVTTSPLPASATLPAGALPPQTTDTVNTNYPKTLQTGNPPAPAPLASGVGQFYWVCLRRPANPFAPVSATNPMVVVDNMRFPYIEGGGVGTAGSPDTISTPPTNTLYSYQRLQPYRGGHAVPAPGGGTAIDTRYGFTEQVAAATVAGSNSGNTGIFGSAGAITKPILHTLGLPNEGAFANPRSANPTQQEQWDYFPFNDRDFTSVAELMLVPGCPPGLFTKQFAEFAPTDANVTTYFKPAVMANLIMPYLPGPPTVASGTATDFFAATPTPVVPHTFPYLVDKFFYSGLSPAAGTLGNTFSDATGDGWFKMLEFFEVPSQMIGAVGPVAQGMNFDWARQDAKPGLINLNLIIDEEVFFSVFGKQDQNFQQQLMNFAQLGTTQTYTIAPNPPTAFTGGSWPPPPGSLDPTSAPIPLVVTATNANGAPAWVYPMSNRGMAALDPLTSTVGNRLKLSFAQFLWLRHGGSGFVFGYGTGLPGQNTAVPTSPVNSYAPAPPNNLIPADRPFHSLSYPDINYTIMRPAALPPSAFTDPHLSTFPTTPIPNPLSTPPYKPNPPTTPYYAGDPGIRNPYLYQSIATGTPPASSTSAAPPTFVAPPAIPARRLFQPPDANQTTNPPSNAGAQGDPYINNVKPVSATPPPTATGALPLPVAANDGFVNLFWTQGTLPAGVPNPYLGSNVSGPTADNRQHSYFRSELLQKAMNLTTVRTHQYAVWITIGFFEVTRQGDLLMIQSGNPILAFDLLGPELGASTGQTTRYRGFFLVDRLKLYGFDDTTPGSFRPAVVYRQTIE